MFRLTQFVKRAPLRSVVVLLGATALCLPATRYVAGQKTNARATAQRRVADRYWKLFVANPRYGSTFERVYSDAVNETGASDSLVEKLNAEIQNSSGESKGKLLTALALVHARRNEVPNAVDALREARELAPNFSPAATALGALLSSTGRFQEGCDVYEAALKLKLTDDERLEVLQKLGELYARLEQTDKATAIWDRAVELYSDRDDALVRIAEIQADAGQFRKASELYAKLEGNARAKRDVEAAVEYAVAVGDMKTRLGEKEEAIKDFERALNDLAPNHWMFKSLRDRIEYVFLLRSDYDGLVDYYREVTSTRPTDLDAARRLAITLGSLGRYEEAREALDAALKRAPSDVSLRYAGIELAVAQNDYATADALYREIDDLGALDVDALVAWGDVALKNDALDFAAKRSNAVAIWSRALNDEKTGVSVSLLVADKLRENQFDDEAEKALVDLKTAYPDDFEIVKNLARLYFDKNEKEKAFAQLDLYVKAKSQNADVYASRAEFLRSAGFRAEAIADFRKAATLAPSDFKKTCDLCEATLDEEDVDANELDADLNALAALAATEDEANRALNLRLRYAQLVGNVQEYLDDLDSQIATADATAAPELYWRKVAAELYFDDPNAATETTIKALRDNLVSRNLMRKIPEIVAKSQAPESALELLDLALAKDPAQKVGYLRSIARANLELGNADAAVDAARQLLALDSNDASNYRAAAETFFECGRVDDAIAALRDAVRIDPADRSSCLRLASALDEIGEPGEATELVWKVFDKCSRLEEKLVVVDALSKLYAKLDRFDELKDRLRNGARNSDERRDAACCLSRAYMTLRDYESARSALETAAALVSGRSQDDVFLLHSLSSLAELQNDANAAIRYQERLCELDDSRSESDRLLALYRRFDQPEKAREYLKKKILPRDPLWKQLETIDVLASVGDYDAAFDLVDEIERRYPDSWEIRARRLELEGWTRSMNLKVALDAEDGVRPFDLKSARETARRRDKQIPANSISGDAWRLGELHGAALNELESPQDYRNLARQTLLAVYRDKLALDDKARRSTSAALARPQAPTPNFPTYGAAFFYRQALRDRSENAEARDALRADRIADFVERFPNVDPGDEKNAEKSAETNVDRLKFRFAALEYALALDSNLAQAGRLDPAARQELQSEANRVALKLSATEDSWRAEVYPQALEDLTSDRAIDETTLAADAAFLVESLEKSYARGSFERDAEIWTRAAATVAALKAKRRPKAAKRAQAILDKASARDYAVLLATGAQTNYISFDDFEASIKAAQALIPRQARNFADVDKAREKLGDAFAARMALDLSNAFAKEDREELERAQRGLEAWTVFAEKISFGRSVLSTFVELRRSDLTGAGNISDATLNAFDDLEKKVYRALDVALDLDVSLNAAFAEKLNARASAAPNLAASDVFTYLARNDQVAFNLAAYLIDKTIYGNERADSTLESGKLLETALAILFALDAAESNGRGQIAFARVERFESFLAKIDSEAKDRALKRYAEKIIETERCVKALLQGDVEPDTVENLRQRALANLSESSVGVAPENKPLLVALALLAKYEKKNLEALEYVERVPCVGLVETKARELAILEAFPEDEDAKIVERRAKAVAFLVGGRLDENEGARLLNALVLAKEDLEARKIRKRLQKFATAQTIVTALLDDVNERAQAGETLDDEDVVFADRVFRTPSWSISDPVELAELRAKALVALAAAGRLNQTSERLEKLVENSPGAAELAMRLADVKLRLDDVDAAKRLLNAVADKLPNDASVVAEYASILARAGDVEGAKAKLQAAYARKPEDYFSARSKPEFWKEDDDLNLIQGFSTEQIAPRAFAVFSFLLEERERPEARETADALLQKFWNAEDADEDARDVVRSSASRLFAQSEDPAFFPQLKTWVLDVLRPNADDQAPYEDYEDVHRLVQWSVERPVLLSSAILDLLDPERDAPALEEFLREVDAFNIDYARRANPNAARQSAALVLKIQILAKLRRLTDALNALAAAEKVDAFCAKGLKSDPFAVALALDFYADARNDADAREVLRRYYERAHAENPHPAYERFFISTIYPLGLKSADASVREKYLRLTRAKLEEVLKLASKADVKSTRRVAGTLETLESISGYALLFVQTLKENGAQSELDAAVDASNVKTRLDHLEDDAVDEWREFFQALADALK